jgi:RNA polymerase primary sigma factor
MEIAEEIGIQEIDVHRMLRVGNRHMSLDAPYEDGRSDRLDSLPAHEEDSSDDSMMRMSLGKALSQSLDMLDKREKEILLLYFGVGHDMAFTLEEIGRRYRLTRERVRQIKEKAVNKLKSTQKNAYLRSFSSLG